MDQYKVWIQLDDALPSGERRVEYYCEAESEEDAKEDALSTYAGLILRSELVAKRCTIR
jgi:hypothetical protein